MEKIMKYILIIIATIFLEWIFLAFTCTIFDSSLEVGAIVGAAVFLTVEMIICTAVIISKIDKNK